MPIAVITFDFDPVLDLGDVTIRWQTVALAATIFVTLCIAAAFARRMRNKVWALENQIEVLQRQERQARAEDYSAQREVMAASGGS